MHEIKVLFLEDEPIIQEVLAEYMKMQNYQVTCVENGDAAVKLLKKERFDIAVLDIMVPGIDGLEVLRELRERNNRIAVLMLTALEDEKTQVRAFNLLADDYIIKPVSPIILLKRMETVLRRMERKEDKEEQSNNGLMIHEEAYSASYNGIPIKLTVSEYLLLETLFKNPKKVFTREQLILHIFNEDYIGNDRIIDAHIKNLRKKMPVDCIKTIIGIGYQFQTEEG